MFQVAKHVQISRFYTIQGCSFTWWPSKYDYDTAFNNIISNQNVYV